MNRVAAVLDVPPIRVYEVATFYTMFNRQVATIFFLSFFDLFFSRSKRSRSMRSSVEGEKKLKKNP